MLKILLSIKPEFADKIMSGEKRFEYRTHVPIKNFDSIVVYSTAPVRKIIGEVEVTGVVSGAPNALWEATKDAAGISRAKYRQYFKGRKTAYAFQLGRIERFERERSLENYGILKAPQSFLYLKDNL